MSQLLKDRHSSNAHENIVRRCMRLCRQVKNAEEYATVLEPFFNEFLQKRQASKVARENAENLYDSKVLMSTILDDKIRDLNEDGKKYDRNQPGSNVNKLMFPNGASTLTNASIDKKPDEVEKLILVLNDLGAEHPLAVHVPILQEAANVLRAAIDAHAEALGASNTAKTFVRIAKSNLNRQYEQVIYAASGKFGKIYASRLFPAIRPGGKKSKAANNNEIES